MLRWITVTSQWSHNFQFTVVYCGKSSSFNKWSYERSLSSETPLCKFVSVALPLCDSLTHTCTPEWVRLKGRGENRDVVVQNRVSDVSRSRCKCTKNDCNYSFRSLTPAIQSEWEWGKEPRIRMRSFRIGPQTWIVLSAVTTPLLIAISFVVLLSHCLR